MQNINKKSVKLFQLAKYLNISHKNIIEYLKTLDIETSINKVLEPKIAKLVLDHFTMDTKKVSQIELIKVKVPQKLEEEQKSEKHIIVDKIKKSITENTDILLQVNNNMKVLREQDYFTKQFNKLNNINDLAVSMDKLSTAQKSSLDLMILLLSATGRMKSDYNKILKSIEEEEKRYDNDIDILEFLAKVKNTLKDFKNRENLLESLLAYTNELRDSIAETNTLLIDKTKVLNENSKILTDKINKMEVSLITFDNAKNKVFLWLVGGIAIALLTAIISILINII